MQKINTDRASIVYNDLNVAFMCARNKQNFLTDTSKCNSDASITKLLLVD